MSKFHLLLASLLVGAAACRSFGRAESPSTQSETGVIRIALLGDPHISRDPALQQYVAHFNTVIDQVNAAHVDAALIAGDLTQNGDAASFATFKQLAARLQPPHWFVAGNHDVGQRELPTSKRSLTEPRLAQFEKLIGPTFFTADVRNNLHLVGITSSLFGSGLPQEQQQWEFLQQQLAHPAAGMTLVLSHYPLYAGAPNEPDGYFNLDPASRVRLMSLLASVPHLLFLSSHLHRPINHNSKGIQDIGSPAISFGLPRSTQKVGWTLLTLSNNAVAIVDIHYLPFEPVPGTQPFTANN